MMNDELRILNDDILNWNSNERLLRFYFVTVFR